MAQKIDRFLQITCTQGGADAFVQGSVTTGIIPEDGMAYELTLVEVLFSLSTLQSVSADCNMEWSLTRDSKTATPLFSDVDVIYSDGWANALTTSGQIILPGRYQWTPPPGTLLVEPTIYAQLDSTSTGQTSACIMRLHYDEVKVSEVDILRLLNNT